MKKGDYDAVYGCWISSIFGNFQLWDPITQKRVVAQQKKICSIFLEWSKMIWYKKNYLIFLLPVTKIELLHDFPKIFRGT